MERKKSASDEPPPYFQRMADLSLKQLENKNCLTPQDENLPLTARLLLVYGNDTSATPMTNLRSTIKNARPKDI